MRRLEETPTHGKFVVEPLERGYGVTLGNSLRRVMISSVQGAAITCVRIEGVLHEFSTIDGLKEDTTELLLNLKDVCIKLEPAVAARGGKHVIRVNRKGMGRITGADIECPDGVQVVNPECYIATISEPRASLLMEMDVETGKGYVLPDKQEALSNQLIGSIQVGAAFTPVRRVNYIVEPRRVGFKTDYEGLVIEITTNGTITPSAALSQASKILDEYYQRFMEFAPEELVVLPAEKVHVGPHEEMPIEEIYFSARTFNCLKRANILTLGELMQQDDNDLLAIRNFGAKSLAEVHAKLEEFGLAEGKEADEAGAESEPPADTPIEKLGFGGRTLNCLKKAEILTLSELRELRDDDLLGIEDFGQKSLAEVHAKLAELDGSEQVVEDDGDPGEKADDDDSASAE